MTPLRIALLAALLAVAAAAPAQAASRLVVSGAGFGHGIGMSQYGAMGFAQQGSSHAAILAHYFTGTQIGKLGGASEVRVLLKRARQIKFSGATGVAGGRSLDPAQTYTAVRGLGAAVTLRSASGRDLGSYETPLAITGSGGGLLVRGRADNDITSGTYRGRLELRPAAIGGVAAINAVGLEDYLRGVVPGEMPPTWPAEALRAQAVAARTYSIATSKNGDGFEQYADTRSQMYTGIAGERPTTDDAVAATRDEIVVFDGKPIVTYYFSTSGGRTENVENSFLGADPAPWLVSVEDPYDAGSPRHRWTKRMSLRGAKRRLGSLLRGQLRQIKVLSRGRSPRVVRAQIVGTGGRTDVSGPRLRAKLGLYDTWARFTVITSRATRGDGNAPTAPAGSTTTGGTRPRVVARFAAVALPVAGTLRGRVSDAVAGSLVDVQRFEGRGWATILQVPVRAGGIYSAAVPAPGLYRVRHEGAAGPVVRVR